MPNPIITNFPTPISSTTTLLLGEKSGLAVLAQCTGTPPTTTDTFAKGCVVYVTDVATGSIGTYINTGTSTTPVWNPVTAAGISGANAPTSTYFALDNGNTSNVIVTLYTIGTTFVPLSTGLMIAVRVKNTLTKQTSNTINFNGTTKSLFSHCNPVKQISTTYVAGGVLQAVYLPGVGGGIWEDLGS